MDEELADCDEGDRCWIHSEREYALHNLSEISKHSKGDELLLIVQAARHHGGATCFREMWALFTFSHYVVSRRF